jgi:hypothetical protein
MEFGRLSSTFYRLVRKDEFGKYDVCDFNTVVNGNLYIQEHENAEIDENGYIINACYHDKIKMTTKEKGNARYEQLKSRGYKFIGMFEKDICGYERRIK